MRVTRLSLRDFRSYDAAELRPGPGLTVITGRNGAGKTNLLEALYFACTGRSCRTGNEREVVRFSAGLTRLRPHARGAGKPSLLAALCFACTGRSCRTGNEREVVRFSAGLTRLELEARDAHGTHAISVGFQPREPENLR